MLSGGLKGFRLERARANSQPARLGDEEDEYEDDFEEYYEEDFEAVPEGEMAAAADAVDEIQDLHLQKTDPRTAQVLQNDAQQVADQQITAEAAPKSQPPPVEQEPKEAPLETDPTGQGHPPAPILMNSTAP